MTGTTISGRVLLAGTAEAPALVLDEALSFWGGFDPGTGEIIDVRHPQRGETLKGRILVLPESRGSAGTPGGIAEAIRAGVGPRGVILGKADVNVTVGAIVAEALYGIAVPVVVLDMQALAAFRTGDIVAIDEQGNITL